MKVFHSGNTTLYIANSIFRQDRMMKSFKDVPIERVLDYIIKKVYRTLGIAGDSETIDKFLDFCQSYSNANGNFKIGILSAHGSMYFGKWFYNKGIIPRPVQKWIDENDGVYDLLLLEVCNPKGVKPTINKSLVVVPTHLVGLLYNSDVDLEHLLVIPHMGAIPIREDKITRLPKYPLFDNLQPYVSNAK
jgi:hypothetical protein